MEQPCPERYSTATQRPAANERLRQTGDQAKSKVLLSWLPIVYKNHSMQKKKMIRKMTAVPKAPGAALHCTDRVQLVHAIALSCTSVKFQTGHKMLRCKSLLSVHSLCLHQSKLS